MANDSEQNWIYFLASLQQLVMVMATSLSYKVRTKLPMLGWAEGTRAFCFSAQQQTQEVQEAYTNMQDCSLPTQDPQVTSFLLY